MNKHHNLTVGFSSEQITRLQMQDASFTVKPDRFRHRPHKGDTVDVTTRDGDTFNGCSVVSARGISVRIAVS